MGNEVYANGMEISCKAANGKAAAAFPDVCFTPPQTPATPPGVPIPYPNTAMASDATDGSQTVQISGQEVMLKDKSCFKKSSGDEAGSAPKKGVVTSQIQGKAYFTAWSMDVKFEGENVVRHLDMTTHNHASQGPNTPPWPYADSMAVDSGDPCQKDKEKEEDACGGKSRSEQCADPDCQAAQSCKLVPKNKDKEQCCPDRDTGHHLIEDHWIRDTDGSLLPGFASLDAKNANGTRYLKPGGSYDGAPTVCADGDRFSKHHGILHGSSGVVEDSMMGKPFNYGQGKATALVAHSDAYPEGKCEWDCLEAQLDKFYGSDPNKSLRTPEATQSLKSEQRAAANTRFGR
jgi:hypothetical protein